MLERLNLQSIGYHIKEESNLTMADRTSFLEREKSAADKLEQGLQERLDEKTIKWLYSVIWDYVERLESIQFSLGMKAGARLELLLTNDDKYDF